MDDSRWFKLICRINAVLLLVAVVMAIGKFVYEQWPWRRRVTCLSNYVTFGLDEEGRKVEKEKWRYDDPVKVPGGAGFIIPLDSTWSADDPSRTWSSTRNLLFVDGDLKAKKWLLPDNEGGISGWEFLAHEKDGPALAILFRMWDRHDDVGKRADAEARKLSVFLARPDCARFAQVLTGLTRCIGKAQVDGNHLVVFYVKDGAGYAAKIAVADFSVVETTTLDPLPP